MKKTKDDQAGVRKGLRPDWDAAYNTVASDKDENAPNNNDDSAVTGNQRKGKSGLVSVSTIDIMIGSMAAYYHDLRSNRSLKSQIPTRTHTLKRLGKYPRRLSKGQKSPEDNALTR